MDLYACVFLSFHVAAQPCEGLMRVITAILISI